MGNFRAWSRHVRWSADEVSILMEHYHKSDWGVLLELLPQRSRDVIRCKANGLGLKRFRLPKRTLDETREAKREFMARKRLENPEACRAYARNHHYKNHEAKKRRMRAYAAKRFFWARAMKLRGEDRATPQQLAALWWRQRGMCALTGRKLDRSAQLDHKIPKARGGGDEIANLQWLCQEANYGKRAMTDAEFIALCRDTARWIGGKSNKPGGEL